MRRVHVEHAKCRCGKVPFYSEAAAADALARHQHAGQVDGKRREVRYYECEHAPGTWHLTSLTVAQYRRRYRIAMLTALTQVCGSDPGAVGQRSGTISPSHRSIALSSAKAVPLLGAARPYSGVITIKAKDVYA